MVALSVAFLLLGCACGADPQASAPPSTHPTELQGRLVVPPSTKPTFTLTDTNGKPYDFAARTKGKLTYLYFGYTSCPDICQIRMRQLVALTARPAMPAATVVFVTTDPDRDTVPVLRDWLSAFDPSFVGLTGTQTEVAAAQQAAGVPVATKKPGTEPGVYLMSHPSAMQSFAPDGTSYVTYPSGTKVQQYLDDARILNKRR